MSDTSNKPEQRPDEDAPAKPSGKDEKDDAKPAPPKNSPPPKPRDNFPEDIYPLW